jgi:hypothetical protein
MSLGELNHTEYANGFNQGMQAASQKFSIFIYLLAALFLFRIIIQIPFIRKKLAEYRAYEISLYNVLDSGSDVLAFFIVVILIHSALGLPVIN